MPQHTRASLLAIIEQAHPPDRARALFTRALARASLADRPLYTPVEVAAIARAVTEEGLEQADAAERELKAALAAEAEYMAKLEAGDGPGGPAGA